VLHPHTPRKDKPADNVEILREKVRADKKVVVASVLELTQSEANVFWPFYNAYQSDIYAFIFEQRG